MKDIRDCGCLELKKRMDEVASGQQRKRIKIPLILTLDDLNTIMPALSSLYLATYIIGKSLNKDVEEKIEPLHDLLQDLMREKIEQLEKVNGKGENQS